MMITMVEVLRWWDSCARRVSINVSSDEQDILMRNVLVKY